MYLVQPNFLEIICISTGNFFFPLGKVNIIDNFYSFQIKLESINLLFISMSFCNEIFHADISY